MNVKQLLEEIELLKKRCPGKWENMPVKLLHVPTIEDKFPNSPQVFYVTKVHGSFYELAFIVETNQEIEKRTGIHDIGIG